MKTLLTAVVLVLSVSALRSPAAEIPAATFAKLPLFSDMALSPDGRYIVALEAYGETYHAVVLDLKKRTQRLLMAADPKKFRFEWCRFANRERVVCEISSHIPLYAGAYTVGIRYYKERMQIATRLLAANVDGSDVLELVKPPRATNPGAPLQWNASDQSTIVSWLVNDKRHILIQLAREDRIFPSLYKLDIYTNKMKRVQRYRDPVLRWYANPEGRLMMAAGLIRSKGPVAFSMVNGWHELDLSVNKGVLPPRVMGESADGKTVWLAANQGNDTQGILAYDLAAHRVSGTLYTNPHYDVRHLALDRRSDTPLYVSYDGEHLGYHWFNDKLERQYDAVSRILPGHPSHVTLVSYSDRLDTLVFYSDGNGTPPSYYVYNDKTKSLMLIARWATDVGTLATLQPVTYKARDGAAIPAYVALPGPAGKGPWPTVVLPHGGPSARTTDRYDYLVQMLVNRGYAVLEPNFRGSTGYGAKFMKAGFDQWGLRMQDDVMDGLDWMIKSGYTDPKRVCIVGLSYGGYVALVAAFKTPNRFRCAESFAGPSDLDKTVYRMRDFEFGNESKLHIEASPLREQNSPLRQVNRIALPLLLIQGDLDEHVRIGQTKAFVAALKKAGKAFTFIEQPHGDHMLATQSQRTQFMEATDRFLARYLSPKAPSSDRSSQKASAGK